MFICILRLPARVVVIIRCFAGMRSSRHLAHCVGFRLYAGLLKDDVMKCLCVLYLCEIKRHSAICEF
jgi:hypothetical protein